MMLSSKKLNSNTGASMIIALIFMLICVFVGGSVLVAATVNGSRVADDRSTQQSILNQRSACSVFAGLLLDNNGNVNISMPYTVDGSAKTPSNPYDSSTDALKYIICKVAGDTVRNNAEKSYDFTMEDTDGNVFSCVAVCKTDYTVYIRFKDNPQVQLRLQGRDVNNTVTWYRVKIIKAEL